MDNKNGAIVDSSKILESLKRARELCKRAWCQEVFARDMNGKEVHYENESAYSFCTRGAIKKAANEIGTPTKKVFDVFKEYTKIEQIVAWNDSSLRVKEDILRAFDKVIAAVQQERV